MSFREAIHQLLQSLQKSNLDISEILSERHNYDKDQLLIFLHRIETISSNIAKIYTKLSIANQTHFINTYTELQQLELNIERLTEILRNELSYTNPL